MLAYLFHLLLRFSQQGADTLCQKYFQMFEFLDVIAIHDLKGLK